MRRTKKRRVFAMNDATASCVLLADRHHSLTEGVRGLLETVFSTVFMVADEASLNRFKQWPTNYSAAIQQARARIESGNIHR